MIVFPESDGLHLKFFQGNTIETKKEDIVKTYSARPKDIKQDWIIVDATDQVLGRMASRVAAVLRGKNKAIFTPHMDTGDYVIVINADKVRLTGQKELQKTYFHHTGFPHGARTSSFRHMRQKSPEWIIQNAVRGMLPHNRLGREIFKKLKVYAGSDHPHEAQQPQLMEL